MQILYVLHATLAKTKDQTRQCCEVWFNSQTAEVIVALVLKRALKPGATKSEIQGITRCTEASEILAGKLGLENQLRDLQICHQANHPACLFCLRLKTPCRCTNPLQDARQPMPIRSCAASLWANQVSASQPTLSSALQRILRVWP